MWENRNFRISDNMYQTFTPILYASRLLGLSPFSVITNGSVRMLKWSLLYQVYSVALFITAAAFTILGLLNDVQIKDYSFGGVGIISQYVTYTDIIMIQTVSILGILNTAVRVRSFYSFMKCICEIDSSVHISDMRKARRTSISVLTLTIAVTMVLQGFDLYVEYTTAKMLNDGFFPIISYLTYYLSYLIFVSIICIYAHMGFSIKIRLDAINECLKTVHFNNKAEESALGGTVQLENSQFSNRHRSTEIDTITLKKFTRRGKIADVVRTKNGNGIKALLGGNPILQLLKTYLITCDAADAVNDFFGHIILVILVASLLHLTVTPYFFIIELTGRCDTSYLILQSLWFFTHFYHLALVVEPCNMSLEEAKSMSGFVCGILSSGRAGVYQKQLELMFRQLQNRQIEFSAFGLGTIDRSLVTSMAGAVTVYLVTILQFRNSAAA